MSAVDFYIKEGDSAPKLEVTAVDEDNEVVPLTAALSVAFWLLDPGGTPKIDGATADIDDAANGIMSYSWQSDGSDTEDPGDYDAEFEVSWSDGTKTTFPNFRYLRVKITKTHETTD